MDKKPSFLWALAIGMLFPILQFSIFFLRFQNLNPDAAAVDYLYFFLSGLLIGLVLIYLLRHSQTQAMYRGAIVGFVIGVPLALLGMILGGLMGPFGIILFSISPVIFVTGVGYIVGQLFGEK